MNFQTVIYDKTTGSILAIHPNRYIRNKHDKLSLCPGKKHDEINFMYFDSRWPLDSTKHHVRILDTFTPPCIIDENGLPLFCTERMLAFMELAAQYQTIIVDLADSMGDQLLRVACLMEAQKKYPGHTFYYTCEDQYRDVLALCPDVTPFPGYKESGLNPKQCGKLKMNGGHLYDPRGDGFSKACVYATWLNLPYVPYNVRLVIPPGFHQRFADFDKKIAFDKFANNVIYQFRSKNWVTKCWDVEKAVELASLIHDTQSCNIYWLGTPADLAADLPGIINLCGKTTWLETVHMLDRATSIFCIDSSVQHLSRALGKKYFTLWGETHPQHIMGEPPRPEDFCATIKTGPSDIHATTAAQVFSRAFPDKQPQTSKPHDPARDVSQHGTQKIIYDFFQDHPPKHRILIDVGAFGRAMSNTFMLMEDGWKGLLFEPCPQRRTIIEDEFRGLNYTLLPYAASHEDGPATLHIHSEAGHDSLDKTWSPEDQTNATIEVEARRLPGILTMYKIPKDFDLLSIDTEGWDEKIMIDFFSTSKYRPALIVTECTSYTDAEILYGKYDYKKIAFVGNPDYGNLVFAKVAAPKKKKTKAAKKNDTTS